VAGFNLSLVLRKVFGRGTARGMQGLAVRLANAMLRFEQAIWRRIIQLGAEVALQMSCRSQLPAAA